MRRPSFDGRHRAVVVREQDFGCHRATEVDQVSSQVDQEVIDRDHPDELLASDDGQPTDGVGAEQREGTMEVGRGVNGDDRGAHDAVDPRIGGQVPWPGLDV